MSYYMPYYHLLIIVGMQVVGNLALDKKSEVFPEPYGVDNKLMSVFMA